MLDRIVSTCMDGRTVRINVMQPLTVNFVTDDQLSVEDRSSAVMAKYKESSGVTAALPKVNVRRLSPKPLSCKNFDIPKAYIKYRVRLNEEMDNILEYDVDEEDMEWLSLISKKLEKAGEERLSVHSFEIAMDRLEKESFFQCSKGDGNYKCLVDQDAVCCVCNDGEGSNINQIIFCDMCNIAVHQDCYGVPYVPEGQWLCRRCQMSPSKPVSCVLCPSSHGAFKQTVDSRWAHVVCALWLNEVHFANSVFMEPIDGIENSLRRRQRLRCIVCKQKVGACLQCSRKSCTRSFHVTCANAAGMEMRAEIVDNPKREGGTEIRYTVFCHFHSTDFAKNDGSDFSKQKKKVDELMKKAREKLAASQAVIPPVSIPTVPHESLKRICEKADISENVIRYIVAYWSLKRKSRFGVPLLRRLIHSKTLPKSADASPTSGQGTHPSETRTYFLLRTNLERVRLLCELVKKREKMKKEFYDSTASLLNRLTKPLNTIMSEVIEKIASKDYSDVFAKPVTEKEVPGYSTVIKNPMDLSTMRKKLAKGDYKNLSQLKSDFTLMMNNCSTFNRHNEFFWKYGHRLHRIGLKYFRVAEKDVQALTLANGVLKTISSISYTPVEGPKLDNEEENDDGLDFVPRKMSTCRSSKGEKTLPTRVSTRKRTLRTFDDSITPKRPKYNLAIESFMTYRSDPLKSPKFLTTDTSTMEESSSADEEIHLRRGRRRNTRKCRKLIPPQPMERPVETVEVACEFQHDDIVWITENDERKIGRVIDLRMRVLLDDLPTDEMFSAKPHDYMQYVLVLYFDGQKNWRWVSVKYVSYCLVKSIKAEDYPPAVREALREAKAFLGM
ncbi:Bromodomain containing protein [Brugia malayi]|uniref:BMA-LIN-49, isoform b n=1 Tax=Brugia malayi TaxID=6279 RepID=A0A0J9Y768_BRUMA|nr:Bromodomain containing protein [Brugia malayi]CDQ03437.1 BMA-LIN-49, isoform b [Brugia malayi]VIO88434.1 Bromodomain containing protein [Brugia malayi]